MRTPAYAPGTDGQRWRYLYDAFGRRRAKRCDAAARSARNDPGSNAATALIDRLGGGSCRPRPLRFLQRADYLWDGPTLAAQWKVYADGSSEHLDSGEPIEAREEAQEWHFEPGGFRPLAVIHQRPGEAPSMLHVVPDLNGMPRELIDSKGKLVWAGQLDTWGRLKRALVQDRDAKPSDHWDGDHGGWQPAANDPVIDLDLRQANQWADEESGLLYNLNRHYDLDLARYASQDPLGPIEGGLRTHGYVHNPVTRVDPWGLVQCPLIDLTEHRAAHILRHRSGTGISGKTEFPAHWSDRSILHHVSDVATDPASLTGNGKWNSPYAVGTRDGVDIRVDFYPPEHPTFAGKISTAYPINVAPNP